MLDVKNMFREDKLFNVTRSLQNWEQTELHRLNVENLSPTCWWTISIITALRGVPKATWKAMPGKNPRNNEMRESLKKTPSKISKQRTSHYKKASNC